MVERSGVRATHEPSGVSAVFESGLGEALPLEIRRLVALGKGHRTQLWVLAQLQQNRPVSLFPSGHALPDGRDRLCALAVAILHHQIRAILVRTKAFLRTGWRGQGKSTCHR